MTSVLKASLLPHSLAVEERKSVAEPNSDSLDKVITITNPQVCHSFAFS